MCWIKSEVEGLNKQVYIENKPKTVLRIEVTVLWLLPFFCKNLDSVCLGVVRPVEDSYLFFKLWGQRVLSENVKRDLLEAEQDG